MPDKIRDEAHALECLAAAAQAGLTPARWAAAHDVHPRSLHGWFIALKRREALRSGRASTPPLRLVELLPTSALTSFRVQVGPFSLDIPPQFEDSALQRLLRLLASC
jgi:hypothetical protein